MSRWLLALLGCSLTLASPARAGDVLDRIVAVVNKDVILSSEVADTYSLVSAEALRGTSASERDAREAELRGDILEGLIGTMLMEQAMESAGMEVEDSEVEAAIADVARQNNLTTEQLFAELKRQGSEPEAYRSELKKQLRQYKFMNLEIRGRVKIADQDVLNYYNQMTADVAPDPAWRLQTILLAYPGTVGAADVARIDAEADALLAEMAGGKAFADIARARSDDPAGRSSGGDAGLVTPDDLSPLFADKLRGTAVGTPTRVDTPGGVFLLRVAESVDRARRPLEEVREDIMRALYDESMDRELELWTQEERRRAHVEILP